jgi:DNA-binding transcriptional regulator YiaG
MDSSKTFQISQISIEEFMGMIDQKINKSLDRLLGAKGNHVADKELLTRQETADYFGVSFGTLHNWAKKGTLIPVSFEGRVYYTREEIQTKLRSAS